MKAKIIADIAISTVTTLFNIWWIKTIPFPPVESYKLIFGHEQSFLQGLSVVITVPILWFSSCYLAFRLIEWIHK